MVTLLCILLHATVTHQVCGKITFLDNYSQFQKKIYKVSVPKIDILSFPLILGGRWNMGHMKVETL